MQITYFKKFLQFDKQLNADKRIVRQLNAKKKETNIRTIEYKQKEERTICITKIGKEVME